MEDTASVGTSLKALVEHNRRVAEEVLAITRSIHSALLDGSGKTYAIGTCDGEPSSIKSDIQNTEEDLTATRDILVAVLQELGQ